MIYCAMPTLQQLSAQWITSEAFLPFGQVIFPAADGKPFDATDAQLQLDQGTPRFYIMRLTQQGRKFRGITRHGRCTQCLGALGGQEWLIAVAPPSIEPKPDRDRLQAFRIPGNCFIKLAVGTWHAGPYFDQDSIDFYNLELSDTNIEDHLTYSFAQQDNLEFEIV